MSDIITEAALLYHCASTRAAYAYCAYPKGVKFMLYNVLAAAADGAEQGGDAMSALIGMVLPFALLIGVMYFLMIRPESKRKKQMARMLNELIVGDEVTTRGGIIGKIVSIKDDTVTVETGADKVRIKFVRDAISSKKAPISD